MLEKSLPTGYIGRGWLQNSGGLKELQGRGLRNFWVVSRGCCHYKKVEIGILPENKLQNFVETNLVLLSPFESSGVWYKRQAEILHLWVWNQEDQRMLARNEGVDLNHLITIPASCFTEDLDGPSLYEENSGECFSQVWQNGKLIGDSWWQKKPSSKEWEAFLVGVGLDFVILPESLRLTYKNFAQWTGLKAFLMSSKRIELLAVLVVLFLFSSVFTYQFASLIRSTYQIYDLKSEVQNLSLKNEEVSGVKERSFDALNEYRIIRSLREDGQLDQINRISTALPKSATKILKWDHQGNKELNVVLADLKPDLESYVESVEKLPGIEGVDISPAGDNQVKLMIILE